MTSSPHFSHVVLLDGFELMAGECGGVRGLFVGGWMDQVSFLVPFYGLFLSVAWLLRIVPPAHDASRGGRCGWRSDAAVVNSAGRGRQPRRRASTDRPN